MLEDCSRHLVTVKERHIPFARSSPGLVVLHKRGWGMLRKRGAASSLEIQ